ncbi:MAG: hypothetical protein ACRD0X_08665, partial [Thermoanaerobaculia bacterium]
ALLALAAPLSAASPEGAEAIVRGDAAWQRRGEGQSQGMPRPEPVREAIAAYEAALADDPTDLAARWKLQRALYFDGEYVATAPLAKLAAFARGRDLGEAGLYVLAAAVGGRERLAELSGAELAARLPDRRLAAELYFWSAAHWGLWGRTRGKLAAAREGVARTVRDYAAAAVALEPTVENGGGHRILGRLHSEAPRIPLVTGWVSKATAVVELERARAMAPDDLLTCLYLAEALLAADSTRRSEALELLRRVASSEPGGDFVVEETRTVDDARRLLSELEG